MAQAAELAQGPYVLGAVGYARMGVERGALDGQAIAAGLPPSSSVDKSGVGFKLGVGYQFNRNFAVEGGYDDLRSFHYRNPGTADTGIKYTARIWNVFGVGTLPLDDGLLVFGKIGIADNRLKADTVETAAYQNKESHVRAAFGVGGEYDLTDNFGLRVEYEYFGKAGSDANFAAHTGTGKGSLSLVSLDAIYRF